MISRRQKLETIRRAAVPARMQPPSITTLPAPYGGLNARDSFEAMKPEDAIELVNWFPGSGKVTVRGGSAEHASRTSETNPVETLATLRTASGEFMLAASGTQVWNATSAGAQGSSIGTGLGNARWSTVVMNGVLGMVNGATAPRTWDGTTFSTMTVSGSGLAVADLIGVNVFKSRSYFWKDSSQDFWYSAVNTLGGALTLFPLGDVGTFGGRLLRMITWTRDGGSGMDDLAVFVMSSGEVIVYAGSNPGSADDWSLVGVFRIGEPLSARSMVKLGGDVVICTTDGYALLSKVLPGATGARGINVSDKIGPLARQRAAELRGVFGWEALHYPGGERLMVNYPAASGAEQHVANIATGAWTVFRGMPARCWTIFGGRPYFGGAAGTVYEADTGSSDAGAKITATGRSAFSYLGTRQNKLVTMVRPLLESAAAVPARIALSTDFDPGLSREVSAIIGAQSASGTKWDTAKWDTFKWAASARTVQEWLAHEARGYAVSPRIQVEQSSAPISWSATTLAHKPSGVI